MKETGRLNSQDIDRLAEDSLDEEGEEMVADDVKKGSIPTRLVNQAKTEEQTNVGLDSGEGRRGDKYTDSMWSIER